MEYDIVVAGGGPAGLAATRALSRQGWHVLCVDPAQPATAKAGAFRSTALLQPARDFLDQIGVWSRVADQATALRVMRVVDTDGTARRLTRDFDSADLGDRPFGWNLRNTDLAAALTKALAEDESADHRTGTALTRMIAREDAVHLWLSDGQHLRCRLMIGADGRDSVARQASGITAHTTRYPQKALSFAVTHSVPHDNVSTEIYRSGGPFTFVPMPDHEGAPCSAIVWMDTAREARRHHEMEEAAFNAAVTERSAGLYGDLTLVGERALWPMASQIARRFHGRRTALVAEAAHAVPPIGAQGLNMSLTDIATLVATTDGMRDPGAADLLSAYDRARRPDAMMRVAGVDILNRAAMPGGRPAAGLRRAGMSALHDVPPLRRAIMRIGLGAGG